MGIREPQLTFTDKQAAEHIATKPTMNEHSRSIGIRQHAVRQDYLAGKVQIRGVKTTENPSDILTKFLPAPTHMKHTNPLNSTSVNTYATSQDNVYTKWKPHLQPNHTNQVSTTTNIPSDRHLTPDEEAAEWPCACPLAPTQHSRPPSKAWSPILLPKNKI